MLEKKKQVIAFGKKNLSRVQRHSSDIVLGLIPIVLLALYFLIYRFNTVTEQHIEQMQFATRLSANTISSYPTIEIPYDPFITAESAIIMDDASQVIVYSKNSTLRFSMASTTKIMTALVALEYFQPDSILTVYSDGIEGAEVGFLQGEQVYFRDMLYGMLLPSGNDAAYAIAENYPGGLAAFVKKMNEKAQQLHLRFTHYADPAGLNDDLNYTTSHDLARLASVALQNPTFREVTGTKSKIIATVNGAKIYPLYNLNQLLGTNGVIGIKTGFTEGAGGVLVTAKEENGKIFIIVVIKSDDRFSDTQILLNYITDNVSYKNFVYR